MVVSAQRYRSRSPGIVIRASVGGSVRFARHLLRSARSWPERASAARFLLRFGLGLVLPELIPNDDTVLTLRGTTYHLGLLSCEIYAFYELYHDRLYERVADFVPRAGWTVLDVGANAGFFALQQAQRGADVYAFEPNPDCYRRLQRSVASNRLGERIRTFNWAIGEAEGRGVMLVPHGSTGTGRVVPRPAHPQGQAMVSITTLDRVAAALPIGRVDLLKIDTEGAELAVLRGAVHTLRLVERVVLEYHSGELRDQARALLRDQGLREVHDIPSDQRPEMGVLYATRRPRGA